MSLSLLSKNWNSMLVWLCCMQFVAVANCRDFPDNFCRLSALWKWSVATFSDRVACRPKSLEGPRDGSGFMHERIYVIQLPSIKMVWGLEKCEVSFNQDALFVDYKFSLWLTRCNSHYVSGKDTSAKSVDKCPASNKRPLPPPLHPSKNNRYTWQIRAVFLSLCFVERK